MSDEILMRRPRLSLPRNSTMTTGLLPLPAAYGPIGSTGGMAIAVIPLSRRGPGSQCIFRNSSTDIALERTSRVVTARKAMTSGILIDTFDHEIVLSIGNCADHVRQFLRPRAFFGCLYPSRRIRHPQLTWRIDVVISLRSAWATPCKASQGPRAVCESNSAIVQPRFSGARFAYRRQL